MTSLAAFSSRLALDWLATEPESRWRTFDGSLTFLDLSGFTAMSERLARVGREGAEEVADVINATFTELLAVAYDLGGGLLKFGGDALLLFFDGAGHERRAVAAAAGMRARLRALGRVRSSAGWVRLGMSVGVHSGEIHAFLVGDTHRELILTGPAASTVVRMEAAAGRGQIVLSASTAAAIPRGCVGQPAGDGFFLRRSPHVVATATTTAALPGAGAAGTASDLVPEMLRHPLATGGGEPEHRQVAVAFVHFDGADRLTVGAGGTARLAAELDTLVATTQSVCAAHGVCFIGSDVDVDGGKLVLIAGAPTSSDDDDERILLAVRALLDAHRSTVLPVRAGIHRGSALAGVIGPPYRRTYTAMGDAVNTAARVMARAGAGEILATPDVLTRSGTLFATADVAPFEAKGKRRPLRAASLGPVVGMRADPFRADLPLIGRDGEMAMLDAAWGRLARGGGTIEIVGEAGLGKTRLLDEIESRHAASGWLRCAARRFDAAAPFAVAGRLLRGALAIGDEATPPEAAEKLRARVEESAPALVPWLPLIASVAGVAVASTPEVDALDRSVVPDKMATTIVELLAAVVPRGGAIVVDDAQWCDEASLAIVRALAAAAPDLGWPIVVARRPGEAFDPVSGEPIVLASLDHDSTTELAELAAGTTVAPVALERAARRSGGNPLFLQQLLAAMADGGDDADALPASVESAIAGRIDRLEPADRALLRHAAVAGDGCRVSTLAHVLSLRDAEEVRRIGRRLSDFLVVGAETVRFRFPLVQEVAYVAMPFKRRRSVHRRVGEFLEATAVDVSSEADVLYRHFAAAGDAARVWRYAPMAAEHARSRYAYASEVAARHRAVDAARVVASPPELRGAWQALGDALQAVGEFTRARRAYRSARSLAGDDAAALARLCLLEGGLWQDEGRYSMALRWYRRGIGVAAPGGAPAAGMAGCAVRLHAGCGAVAYHQGRFGVAHGHAEAALALAEAHEDAPGKGHALVLLHLIAIGRRDPGADAIGHEALALLRRLRLAGEEATVLNNLGLSAFERGSIDEAARLYGEAIVAYEAAGRPLEAAIVRNNLAEVASDQGKWETAAAGFRRARAAMQATGFQFEPLVASNLARLAAREGRYDEALQAYAEALAGASAMNAPWYEAEMQVRVAECHVLAGRPDAALAALAAVDVPETTLTFARRVEGMALADAGDVEQAHRVLAQAADRASERGERYDEAMCRLELGRLGDADQHAIAESLLAGIGVVALPVRQAP